MNKETFFNTYNKKTVEDGITLLAASASKAFMDLQLLINAEALNRDPVKAKEAVMRPVDLIDMVEILEELFIAEFKELILKSTETFLEVANKDMGYER